MKHRKEAIARLPIFCAFCATLRLLLLPLSRPVISCASQLKLQQNLGGKRDAKTSYVYCSDYTGVGLSDCPWPGLQKNQRVSDRI